MTASKISTDEAKKDKLFYFVANVVVYRDSDGRCLILKRDKREKVHPEKYATPGGKLEWTDLDINHPTRINGDVLDYENAVEELLKREVKEEAGIEIDAPFVYVNSIAYVRPDGIPVIMIKLGAKYKSGDVVLEKGSFTGYAWVNSKEVEKYECVKGIKEEVAQTIRAFSR